MFPTLVVSWHHRLVESYILKAFRGEIKKLMIREPPRHTKSLMISKALPAWWLGHRPQDEIINATYSDDFAKDFGRVVRNWIGSQRYQSIFPGVALAQDSQAANRFNTNKGGIYVSVGFGGTITGRGANLLGIDDIYKDRQDADSPAIRKQVKDWYEAVAYSRLQPGGVQIITLTNWNDGGLDNYLIREGIKNKDPWTVVDLPALIEEDFPVMCKEDKRKKGEALWPERFSAEHLRDKVKKTVGPKNWASMWQQKAQADGGAIILRKWVRYFNKYPDITWFDKVWQSWDLTFKETADGSYVVGQVWAKKGADFYLLDQARRRMSYVDSKASLITLSAKWPSALQKLVEDKANGPALKSDLEHTVPGIILVPTKGGDKADRLDGVSPLFAAGNVYFPSPEICGLDDEGQPWVTGCVDEIVGMPSSEHDDQADTCSQSLAYERSDDGANFFEAQM